MAPCGHSPKPKSRRIFIHTEVPFQENTASEGIKMKHSFFVINKVKRIVIEKKSQIINKNMIDKFIVLEFNEAYLILRLT